MRRHQYVPPIDWGTACELCNKAKGLHKMAAEDWILGEEIPWEREMTSLEIRDRGKIIQQWVRVGISAAKKKDFDKAEEAFNEAIAEIEEIQDNFEVE